MKLPVESEQSFSRKLKDLGCQKKQFRMKDGKKPYCWFGIKLVDWKVSEDTAQETLETEFTEAVKEEMK